MKMLRIITPLLLALAATSPAFAHGGGHGGHGGHFRGSFGVFIGAPLWGWYAPPPAYYYPPVVEVPVAPPVYIERAPAAAYWYYCDNPAGYYPYVRQCPGGWQRVAPQAPPP